MRTAFFAVLVSCVLGCATSHQAYNRVDEQLKQVRIGMTKAQVSGLLGSPTRIGSSVTSEGRRDEWVYSEWTLTENLLSGGQQWAYGMAKGAKGDKGTQYYRYFFKDDVLVEMRDF